MKRSRYVSLPITESQIGGGKAFRESQINNVSERQINQLKSFASRIKANSLTDIESINSEEETDQNESSTNNFIPKTMSRVEDSKVDKTVEVDQAKKVEPDSDTSSDNVPSQQDQEDESNLEKIKNVPFIKVKL